MSGFEDEGWLNAVVESYYKEPETGFHITLRREGSVLEEKGHGA